MQNTKLSVEPTANTQCMNQQSQNTKLDRNTYNLAKVVGFMMKSNSCKCKKSTNRLWAWFTIWLQTKLIELSIHSNQVFKELPRRCWAKNMSLVWHLCLPLQRLLLSLGNPPPTQTWLQGFHFELYMEFKALQRLVFRESSCNGPMLEHTVDDFFALSKRMYERLIACSTAVAPSFNYFGLAKYTSSSTNPCRRTSEDEKGQSEKSNQCQVQKTII